MKGKTRAGLSRMADVFKGWKVNLVHLDSIESKCPYCKKPIEIRKEYSEKSSWSVEKL